MKKVISLILAVLLCSAMLVGCGSDGITIAVPNDTTNEARALMLLNDMGIITLKDGAGITATIQDIAENPLNIKFSEVEAAQLPNVLQDMDYAVINSNYAIDAGLNPLEDSIAIEETDSPYVNLIAVNAGDEDDERIKALVEALTSEEIQEFILNEWGGSVVPVK